MGCGSSSLKGDPVADVGGAAEPNMKKVKTNFADVDYDATTKGKQDSTLAPHESQEPVTIGDGHKSRSSAEAPDPLHHQTAASSARAEMMGDTSLPEGDKLAPYKSVGNADAAFDNPTSDASMAKFARESEPINNQVSSNHKPSKGSSPSNPNPDNSSASEPKKKGWYQRYSDHKVGRNNPISDEDLEKYTGMTRAEHDKFKADPNNELAGNQNPHRVTGSAAGGFGGIAAADGVAGWGYGDGGRKFK